MMSRTAALSFAVLLAILHNGSCLRCYQCNSQTDPTCADPFSSKANVVDCNTQDSVNYNRGYLINVLPRDFMDGIAGAPRYCHKIVMQGGTVIRTCLDANPGDLNHTCRLIENAAKATAVVDSKKLIKHCSVCDKDGCNGAGSITASIPLAILAVVASYLYCKQ